VNMQLWVLTTVPMIVLREAPMAQVVLVDET
jgi:hypothetical protein